MNTDRYDQIVAVSRQALVFGEQSATHTGEEPFTDPVLETYFLLYVLGALDWFAAHPADGEPLTDGERLGAMAEALDAFGTSTPEQTRRTVLMLEGAADAPALAIRAEGARAAKQWAGGDNPDATRRFRNLMDDPDNFPRVVEPVRRESDRS